MSKVDSVGGIAAWAAMWSARHRALAIIGWLVFVMASPSLVDTGAWSTPGAATIATASPAKRAVSSQQASFPDRAGEMVLVQGKPFADPAFQAAVRDAVVNIQATGENPAIPTPDNGLIAPTAIRR